MTRVIRSDCYHYEVIGWSGTNGEITSETDDRFSYLPRAVDHETGEIGPAAESVGERGLMPFNLREIIAMGFTTDEYIAMMRYEVASSFEDHIRTEEELNALMLSQIGWTRRPRDEELMRAIPPVRAAAEEREQAAANEVHEYNYWR